MSKKITRPENDARDILASITPHHCLEIFKQWRTVELWKSKPTMTTPFRVLVYCTKKKHEGDELFLMPEDGLKHGFSAEMYLLAPEGSYSEDNVLNGKIIGEFIVDSITEHTWVIDPCDCDPVFEPYHRKSYYQPDVDADACCMKLGEIEAYGNKRTIYSWHIKDPMLYSKPLNVTQILKPCIMPEQPYCPCCEKGFIQISDEEAEFYRVDGECNTKWICCNGMQNAPHGWCYVSKRRATE